jgi:plastocyanin
MNESKMKPIAMRCNEAQFNEIKQILIDNGYRPEQIDSFTEYPYLINNRHGIPGIVTNYTGEIHAVGLHERTIYYEWDADIFLKSCGIETKPKFKPIAMKFNVEQLNSIRSILEENGCTIDDIRNIHTFNYLVNNYNGISKLISNTCILDTSRTAYEEWDADLFLKSCGIETKLKTENKMKTVITAQELLEIHKVACDAWKITIRHHYFPRIKDNQTVKFVQEEINAMFYAATAEQKPVLEKIFGKQIKPIEWDRIKTGSQVMLEYSGEHCCGFGEMDKSKPVDVVFYKTPHYINDVNKFGTKGAYSYYCTFHQNGKYILFTADKNTNYITEVIQY